MDPFAEHATYPLTAFDSLFERTTFLTGWLVEGIIDTDALSEALKRLTKKWRMLAGRLESMQNEDDETEWRIGIPLGEIPEDYKSFKLTVAFADHPLSHYLPGSTNPLPPLTRSLPHSLLIDPSTPRQFSVWESLSHPLTCWHITHFPAEPVENGKVYTAIGFARSHGMFDGIGAGAIARALVAEMKGESWDVPALPPSGFNANPMQEAIEQMSSAQDIGQPEGGDGTGSAEKEVGYAGGWTGFAVLGVSGAMKTIAWHMRERWWSGADRRVLVMPQGVYSSTVDGVKAELIRAEKDVSNVSSGDILVAWIMKTVYSDKAISSKMTIQCSNLASFRQQISNFSSNPDAILNYPHNAFVPLPYPILSVEDIRATTLSELATTFSQARLALSSAHILSSYKAIKQSVTAFPTNPHAHETLLVSNVSASQIFETDWRPVGATRTVCGYRYQLTPTELMMTNSVYISGRLDDGSVVIDVSLSRERADSLVKAIGTIQAGLHAT